MYSDHHNKAPGKVKLHMPARYCPSIPGISICFAIEDKAGNRSVGKDMSLALYWAQISCQNFIRSKSLPHFTTSLNLDLKVFPTPNSGQLVRGFCKSPHSQSTPDRHSHTSSEGVKWTTLVASNRSWSAHARPSKGSSRASQNCSPVFQTSCLIFSLQVAFTGIPFGVSNSTRWNRGRSL